MNKPHVKLLNYKNKLFFVYDVNKNIVINISKINHDKLADGFIYSNKIKVEHEDDEFKKLLDNLSFEYPTKIEQPLKKYVSAYMNHRMAGVVLQVTHNCNLRCKYCSFSQDGMFDRKHNLSNMSFDVAKKAIEILKEHSEDLRIVRISFYGGEPLLNFNLIKKCVDYAKKIMPYKKIVFAMTTNLTIINKEIMSFLVQHDFKLTVSLDGPEYIHNYNRLLASTGQGSFKYVYKNLQELNNIYPEFAKNVQVNSVVDKSTDISIIEKFFKSSELTKDLKINYSIVDDTHLVKNYYMSKDYYQRLKTNIFKGILTQVLDEKKEIPLSDEFFDKYLENDEAIYDFSTSVHHGGPCIPGIKKLFVSIDGKFFPCEKASGTSNYLSIGNIYDGLDEEKIKELFDIGKISEENCKKCWAIKLCSCCCVQIDNGIELSKDMKHSHCLLQKKEIEKRLFQKGLINLCKRYIYE